MNKFKVGDKITGKNGALYQYTNSNAIMRVEEIGNDGMLKVKLLGYKSFPICYTEDDEWEFTSVIGHTFHVNSEDFKHFKNNSKKKNKKIMKKQKKAYPYYEVRQSGRKIIVKYYLDATHMYKGEACCHKSDKFNFKIGFDIAYDRVMNKVELALQKSADAKSYVWLKTFEGTSPYGNYDKVVGQVDSGKELREHYCVVIDAFIKNGYLLELKY